MTIWAAAREWSTHTWVHNADPPRGSSPEPRSGLGVLADDGDPVLRSGAHVDEELDVASERIEVDLTDEPVRALLEDGVIVTAVGEEVVDRDPVRRGRVDRDAV